MRHSVIFLVSSLKGVNTGIGGHYRSIKEISDLLSSELDVDVLTWGDVPSPVFDGDPRYRHIHTCSPFSPNGIHGLRKAVRHIIDGRSERRVTLVTVGWMFSCISALAATGLRVRHVHLKPGGDAARHPRLLAGISVAVFHLKDYDVYRQLEPNRHMALVPGRVTPPAFDQEYLGKATVPDRGPGRVAIATVMRIASDKRRPAMMLHRALSHMTSPAIAERISFTHLGTVQDEALLRDIQAIQIPFPRYMVSDAASTESGPKYLHSQDVFVGIGRGVMEAMSLGKPSFIPVDGPDGIPAICAVTSANWKTFLRENFTHRTAYSELLEAGEMIRLEEAIGNTAVLERLGKECLVVYEENLSPRASLDSWLTFLGSEHPAATRVDTARRLSYLTGIELKRLARRLISAVKQPSLRSQGQ